MPQRKVGLPIRADKEPGTENEFSGLMVSVMLEMSTLPPLRAYAAPSNRKANAPCGLSRGGSST